MKRTAIFFLLVCIPLIGMDAQNWLTDFDQAKEIAENQDRQILLVFSGSDWCAPCIRLERNIWQSQEFIDFAREHYVLLRADFPRSRKKRLPDDQMKKNEVLAEKYNARGFFPLVVLLNSGGSVLGTTGYKDASPSEYIEVLKSLNR
jgi:thioredoxin-related protein